MVETSHKPKIIFMIIFKLQIECFNWNINFLHKAKNRLLHLLQKTNQHNCNHSYYKTFSNLKTKS